MFKQSIVLIMLFTIITSEKPFQKMKDFITEGIKQYPKDYKKYVKDFKVSIDFLKTKDKYEVSAKCYGNLDCKIKIARSIFNEKDNFELFDYQYKENIFNYTTINYGVDKIKNSLHFIFTRVNVTAKSITQYSTEEKTACVKHFNMYKCNKVYVKRPRSLNKTELNSVVEAAKIKAYNEILTKLNEIL